MYIFEAVLIELMLDEEYELLFATQENSFDSISDGKCCQRYVPTGSAK